MSISRHIIDDFHSIFYHLDDDECDEEIPVWGARLPRLYHAETQNGKTAGEPN